MNIKSSLANEFLLFLFFPVLLIGCQEVTAPETVVSEPPPEIEFIRPRDHRALEVFFSDRSYDWGNIESGVPAFIMERLPEDLNRLDSVTKKKRLFFLSLLPMVLLANEEVLGQRETLQQLCDRHDTGEILSDEEKDLIDKLVEEYGIKSSPLDNASARKELLRRIDMVPPSLVLAQAASESAYGTSRFAREGNNLFGQWTFVPGTGLVPNQRPPGATYEVRRFSTLYASLKSYLKNLNTHRAYRPLREQRANMRAAGLPLKGHDLARGLLHYSERREAYVDDLRAIIRRNHLSRLSQAELRKSSPKNSIDIQDQKARYRRSSDPIDLKPAA